MSLQNDLNNPRLVSDNKFLHQSQNFERKKNISLQLQQNDKISSNGKNKSPDNVSQNSGLILSQSCVDLSLMLGNAAIHRQTHAMEFINKQKQRTVNAEINKSLSLSDIEDYDEEENEQEINDQDKVDSFSHSFERIQKFNAIEEVQEQDEMSNKLIKKIINSKEHNIQDSSKDQSKKNKKELQQSLIKEINEQKSENLENEDENNNVINSSKNSNNEKSQYINSENRNINLRKLSQNNVPKSSSLIVNSQQKPLKKVQNKKKKSNCVQVDIIDQQKLQQSNVSCRQVQHQAFEQIQSIINLQSQEYQYAENISKKMSDFNEKQCQCVPKILLVDDNDFNLMPLSILISQLFQIKTEQANNGVQALSMFEENYKACFCENRSYKFIFMDLNMPEMDGYEASQKILSFTKNDEHEDYVHIVALTSFSGTDVIERCKHIGMKDVINKPLNHKDLQRIIYLHFYRLTLEQFQTRFPNLQ